MSDETRGVMTDETRDFVRELSRDLSPVERIARLRTGTLRVLGLWAVATVAVLMVRGPTANLQDPVRMLGGFGAILSGLSLVGLGGLVAALSMAVPGRTPTARVATTSLSFGLLISVGLGALLLRADPAAAVPPTLLSDATCLLLAAIVAALPALGALLYVARAAPPRPVSALVGIGLGCVALGAFTAQLGCTDGALRHLLVSHASAPAIGAALFLAPLWAGFRRLRRF